MIIRRKKETDGFRNVVCCGVVWCGVWCGGVWCGVLCCVVLCGVAMEKVPINTRQTVQFET
jgi:hypothetical protein